MLFSQSKKSLNLYITSDEIFISELSNGYNPKLRKNYLISQTQDAKLSDTLITWFNKNEMQKIKLNIVLGINHVRYIVIPWNIKLANKQFRQTIAQALFADQFNESAANYALFLSSVRYKSFLVAAFIKKDLLNDINHLSENHNYSIASIAPMLMPVWNHFNKVLTSEESQVIIWENNRALFIENHFGSIQKVKVTSFNPNDVDINMYNRKETIRLFPHIKTDISKLKPFPKARAVHDNLSHAPFSISLCGFI